MRCIHKSVTIANMALPTVVLKSLAEESLDDVNLTSIWTRNCYGDNKYGVIGSERSKQCMTIFFNDITNLNPHSRNFRSFSNKSGFLSHSIPIICH